MKKAFKIVLIVVIVVIVAACAIAADSRKKQAFHGVEFKLRESWERTLNKNVSNENLLVYQPSKKKPDTLWIYFIQTEKSATDEISELLPFDDNSEIINQNIEKINGSDVSIYDVSCYNGLTVQKIAVTDGDAGLIAFCHNYDAKEDFPETKEMEKIINSIK